MGYLILLFTSTTQQLNLPPNLLEAICYVETRHSISAIHVNDGDTSSLGICQIKLKTARWLGFKGTESELLEPAINIYYAGRYLQYQLNRYHSVNQAVIAYNFGNSKGFTTSKYQAKVFEYWRQH